MQNTTNTSPSSSRGLQSLMSNFCSDLAPIKPAWFEFVLSPATLKSHLEKPGCDPTATDLITQFLANLPNLADEAKKPIALSNGNTNFSNGTPTANSTNNGLANNTISSTQPNANGQQQQQQQQINQQTASSSVTSSSQSSDSNSRNDALAFAEDAKYRVKKAHALKTLALKTASFLDWNIESFEHNLSVSTQIALMNELKHVCNQPGTPDEYNLFANILYSRWYVRSSISYRLSRIQPENNNPQIIAPPNTGAVIEIPSTSCQDLSDLFIRDTSSVNQIMQFLESQDHLTPKPKRPKLESPCKRPTIDCFDFRLNNWDHGTPIDMQEFLESAIYDLGKYFFFGEMYKEARDVLQRIDADSSVIYPHSKNYLQSSIAMLDTSRSETPEEIDCREVDEEERIEAYLNRSRAKPKSIGDVEEGEISDMDEGHQEDHIIDTEIDLDIRLIKPTTTKDSTEMFAMLASQDKDERFLSANATQAPLRTLALDSQSKINNPPDDCTIITIKGELYMSRGEYFQAMGNFVEVLIIMTEYFTHFSTNYLEEENIINRMIQCSIKLGCYTQAVVLYQMTNNLNYGVAFKQLNERFCNDCCDDLYECIWDITLLEYIIHIHTKRGEFERKCRLVQLIGQLELNENNSEEILFEAMQSRRARFYRIMAKKYL